MVQTSLVGETLAGRYQIDELIGQGGMSAVYKATDPNLKRVVAIKVIHPHLAQDPRFIARFEEEATSVAQLRHPNIVQVFDFAHDGDLFFMVQEFIPGETLHQRLARIESSRLLSFVETIQYTAQICDAADYAHRRGMIHRDIKPANIMLDIHGQAILMDFGIVKITGATHHTATGAVVGTALYMAPEVIRGETPDARSDLYSLGITLYEMVSGQPPFKAESAMTLMMMHLQDPVPDPRGLRADVPGDLVGVIDRAVAKEPNQRYQSMAEMAAALYQVLARLQGKEVITLAGVPDDTRLDGALTPVLPLVRETAPTPPPVSASAQPASTPGVPLQAVGVAGPTAVSATPAPTPQQKASSDAPPRRRRRIVFVGLALLALAILAGTVGVGLKARSDRLAQGAVAAAEATATWLEADDDRDGLANQVELDLKTLPDERDTDGDGLWDGDEVERGTDPLVRDTDDDGLPDDEEVSWGSNPLIPDSDGDDLLDGEEVRRGLDPTKSDTDGDGQADGTDPDPGRAPTPDVAATAQTMAQATGTAEAAARATEQARASATQTAAAQMTATQSAKDQVVADQTAQAEAEATQTAQARAAATQTAQAAATQTAQAEAEATQAAQAQAAATQTAQAETEAAQAAQARAATQTAQARAAATQTAQARAAATQTAQAIPYPAPVLIEPPEAITLSDVGHFVWQWANPPLGDDMFFDLRIWSEQEEQQGREPRGATALTRATEADVHLEFVPAIMDFKSGPFYWTVVVVRGVDSPRIVSEWGEKRPFVYRPMPTPMPTPTPQPC